MKNWLLKTAVNLLGGVDGIVEYALKWFNDNVLAKITDKEEFAAYADDVAAFGFFLDGVLNRHAKWMSEGKRTALVTTIGAVNQLANALKDAKVEKAELDAIIDTIVDAINAWKDAK